MFFFFRNSVGLLTKSFLFIVEWSDEYHKNISLFPETLTILITFHYNHS
jgi:hypothetical protein